VNPPATSTPPVPTGGGGDGRRRRRLRFPEFNDTDAGVDLSSVDVDDATFTNPTQGLFEADDDLADIGGIDGP
jgi:hypothetical protein